MGAKEDAIFTHMKTFLTVSALVLAAGYPCVAFAESFGLRVPAFVNPNAVVTIFSLALFALLALGDYARRPRTLSQPLLDRAPSKRRRETHRLAA